MQENESDWIAGGEPQRIKNATMPSKQGPATIHVFNFTVQCASAAQVQVLLRTGLPAPDVEAARVSGEHAQAVSTASVPLTGCQSNAGARAAVHGHPTISSHAGCVVEARTFWDVDCGVVSLVV